MKGPRIVRRKAIDTERDPYLNKLGPNEMAVCSGCGAVYQDKRWTLKAAIVKAAEGAAKVHVLCPACQKIKEGFAEGFVTLQGDFLKDHKDEILNLIRNKEERSRYINPLSRIIKVNESNGRIEITTTTEKLAQRIGQILKKAFNGEVEYKWSEGVKLARVVWTR